jgi:hypothetical protein
MTRRATVVGVFRSDLLVPSWCGAPGATVVIL